MYLYLNNGTRPVCDLLVNDTHGNIHVRRTNLSYSNGVCGIIRILSVVICMCRKRILHSIGVHWWLSIICAPHRPFTVSYNRSHKNIIIHVRVSYFAQKSYYMQSSCASNKVDFVRIHRSRDLFDRYTIISIYIYYIPV